MPELRRLNISDSLRSLNGKQSASPLQFESVNPADKATISSGPKWLRQRARATMATQVSAAMLLQRMVRGFLARQERKKLGTKKHEKLYDCVVAKMQRQRELVVQELYETEGKYLSQLRQVKQVCAITYAVTHSYSISLHLCWSRMFAHLQRFRLYSVTWNKYIS